MNIKQKKKNHDHYTYYFADGTQSIVTVQDVGQEWINQLWELNDKETNNNRKETRKHISIDALVEERDEPMAYDKYFTEDYFGEIHDERLNEALRSLTEAQLDLLYDIVIRGFSQKEIAERDGVSGTAIHCRKQVIFKKIKKFFEMT